MWIERRYAGVERVSTLDARAEMRIIFTRFSSHIRARPPGPSTAHPGCLPRSVCGPLFLGNNPTGFSIPRAQRRVPSLPRVNSGASEAMHASRRSARQAVQPHAPERSKATLLTNLGASEAMHASRLSAREGVQSTARNQNEREVLGDQITICERDGGPRQLTAQAHAFRQQGAIGPAVTSRACANVSLPPRASWRRAPYSTRPRARHVGTRVDAYS